MAAEPRITPTISPLFGCDCRLKADTAFVMWSPSDLKQQPDEVNMNQ